jgi:pimeloyl-ACP methyl ester carboxylesterase
VVVSSQPVAIHEVHGGGGLRLDVREWGNPTGTPVVFIHGWSQSQLCWMRQLESPLAESFRLVTFDNRGHGTSEKPLAADHYTDGRLWADDLAAVVDQVGLERPVLVAWSYGGFVVADYLRAYGDGSVRAINLVGGAVLLKPPSFDHIGPGFLENVQGACSPDLPTSIAAMLGFLRRCTAEPLSEDDWSAALAWNMVVPPAVRGALLAREIDSDDVFGAVTLPVLLSHGRADQIVLPSMTEHVGEICATAESSWYDGVGHLAFWEAHERFNNELAAFVAGVS